MKILFASDIHGSAYYCRRLLDIYKETKASRMVILGDILYHGPRNDLPKEYAPKEVIAMLNPLKDQIYAVRGNCDTEVDQMVLQFPILADYALLVLDGKTFYATHGCLLYTSHAHALSRSTACLRRQGIRYIANSDSPRFALYCLLRRRNLR